MTGPFAKDNIPSIPFVSTTEQAAAEASGAFAPGVTWVRLDGGTVAEAGFVDLTGAFVSTSGGGGLQEVSTFADLLAISSPTEGQEVRVTTEAQFGEYRYRITLGGDAVGEWFPTEVYNLGGDWARLSGTLEPSKVRSSNGGGTNVAADFFASTSPQKGWISSFLDASVTDVAGDIQFVSDALIRQIVMTPLDGDPIAFGTLFFMIIEASHTVRVGGAAGLQGRFRVDAGQGKFGYLSMNYDNTAPVNNYGWVTSGGGSIANGAVHAAPFDKIFVLFNHIDPTTVTAAGGLVGVSKIWAPGIATPWRGGLFGVASLAQARINELSNQTSGADTSFIGTNTVGSTVLLRKFYVFQLN